jgi:hypothetical protein
MKENAKPTGQDRETLKYRITSVVYAPYKQCTREGTKEHENLGWWLERAIRLVVNLACFLWILACRGFQTLTIQSRVRLKVNENSNLRIPFERRWDVLVVGCQDVAIGCKEERELAEKGGRNKADRLGPLGS